MAQRYKELTQEALAAGFRVVRRKGGHLQLRHPDGRMLTIPTHPRAFQGGRESSLVGSIRRTINGRPSRGQIATGGG